jgi:peptidoglycan/xylan/chitin deacetylase (PgdA/CDA1 family)
MHHPDDQDVMRNAHADPKLGVATTDSRAARPRPAKRNFVRREEAARRLFMVSAITSIILGLLAVVSLITGVGAQWSAWGGQHWLGTPTSVPSTKQQAVTPAMAPATPTTAPHSRLGGEPIGSPQGCGLGGARPMPLPPAIYSASGSSSARGEVAVTFDDGPSPVYTRQILSILNAWRVRATFFVVGHHAQLYPDIVRAEWLAGNAVGNHTFSHPFLPGVSPAQLQSQLSTTTRALQAITDDPCIWLFRPPYGGVDANILAEARRQGLTTVLWDVQAEDWLRPGASIIASRIVSQLHSGAIILLHDSAPDGEIPDRSQTVAALPTILAAIRNDGLRAVTLPHLLLDAGLVRRPAPPPTPPLPRRSQRAPNPPDALSPGRASSSIAE